MKCLLVFFNALVIVNLKIFKNMRKINEFMFAEDLDENGNGAIFPDSIEGKELGFTSDKYSFASYLFRQDKVITISFIETITPGSGHFSLLLDNLKKAGYSIRVPTPSNLMRVILIKKDFIGTRDNNGCEIWVER